MRDVKDVAGVPVVARLKGVSFVEGHPQATIWAKCRQ